VGCGSIPATAVTLVRLTDAEVTCLDHDTDAVSNARRFVRNCGLGSKITVLEGDGREFRFDGFSSGIVALHTIGKSDVVDNLLARADRGDRLVVRYPRPTLIDQYGHPDERYRPTDSVDQFGLGLDRSALLVV
jgi:precorrin-6B methylase 2